MMEMAQSLACSECITTQRRQLFTGMESAGTTSVYTGVPRDSQHIDYLVCYLLKNDDHD